MNARALIRTAMAAMTAPLSPAALWEYASNPAADIDTLRGLLHRTWGDTYSPMRHLPREQWVAMFRRVGFFNMMQPHAAPPTGTLTLFRGAHPDYARGLSWTDTAATAVMFAQRSPVPARVYRAVVPASAVLGALHAAGTFTEFIVDIPADVEVAEASALSAA